MRREEIENIFREIKKMIKRDYLYFLKSYDYDNDSIILNRYISYKSKIKYKIDIESEIEIINKKNLEIIDKSEIKLYILYLEDKNQNQSISLFYDDMKISEINIEFFDIDNILSIIKNNIYNFIDNYIKNYEIE